MRLSGVAGLARAGAWHSLLQGDPLSAGLIDTHASPFWAAGALYRWSWWALPDLSVFKIGY